IVDIATVSLGPNVVGLAEYLDLRHAAPPFQLRQTPFGAQSSLSPPAESTIYGNSEIDRGIRFRPAGRRSERRGRADVSPHSTHAVSFSRRSRTVSCSRSRRSTEPRDSAASRSAFRAAATSPLSFSLSDSRAFNRVRSFSILRSSVSKIFALSIRTSRRL